MNEEMLFFDIVMILWLFWNLFCKDFLSLSFFGNRIFLMNL